MRLYWTQEHEMMNLDAIILSGGIAITLMSASFFGINAENVVLYLLVGLVMSGYKLFKSNGYKRHEVVASILLCFFFSTIIAPSIELKSELHPLTVGAILGVLILLGEVGIYLFIEKLTGWEVEKPKSKRKPIDK